MKFKIDKAKIISEFQSLAAVADKKQTLPILSNILIRCEADSIKLLSTDLEVELEVCLSGANIEQPGETTIPAKKQPILLESSQRARFRLSLMKKAQN